ncbi:MAG TPA: sensor domain-containing protein [Mycobacteriales bacterium]
MIEASSPAARAPRRVPAFFTALLTRRTWAELLYALVGLPQGVFGFVFVVVTTSLSLGLIVTFVGLPLLAASGLVARWIGWQWREGTNAFLGWDTPAPRRFRSGRGLFGWLGACLVDGTAWRARIYLLLKLPLGIASFVTAVVCYVDGLGFLTYGIWYRWLPCTTDDGVCHRAATLWGGYYVDSAPRILWVAAVGLLLLLVGPWAVRLVLFVDRVAVGALLGPSWNATRVEELEQTRAHAVDDAAATLRRIERDLHDGTQARLVALAMNVGLAKEKLAEGADPADAAELLDRAHRTAKEAITEVRDLARGIHPAVLDAGLDTALTTLAAQSAVPVRLTTRLTARATPAIETIAYFCAAELVTNVAKHSGAISAALDARTAGGRLRLQVSDDGSGGAQVGAGTGLSGLHERVRAVDGMLTVHSPVGGPTVVTVDLPLQSGAS